jgi:ferric-dicitrate binding protein FerR (iron transport regulator)
MSHDPTPSIESLLRLAGERDQPAAESMERARATARQSWQRAVAGPRKEGIRRWSLAAALAAGLAIAAFWPRLPQPVMVGAVTVLSGDVRLDSKRSLTAGGVLRSGDILDVGTGRVALALGDALSLRVNSGSRLRFDGVGHVTLLRGGLYVDSGGLNAHAALRIDTPAGEVRHVGTQFQVFVGDGFTRVQVREGRVVLTRERGDRVDLAAGDLAVVGANLHLEHGQPTHGTAWEWTASIAPSFDIENRPLSEFLTWLAREHGWQTRYTDAATQLRAQDIRLHGSMADLDAAGMLERAALITGMPIALQDGQLNVGEAALGVQKP